MIGAGGGSGILANGALLGGGSGGSGVGGDFNLLGGSASSGGEGTVNGFSHSGSSEWGGGFASSVNGADGQDGTFLAPGVGGGAIGMATNQQIGGDGAPGVVVVEEYF